MDKKEYKKKYLLENKEKHNEWKRGYYQRNIEKMRERARIQSKKYRRKYPELISKKQKENKEASRLWRIEHFKNKPEAFKKAKLSAFKSRTKIIISFEDYNKMFEKQNNLCAICGEKETRNEILSLDHCHKLNRVRGLLCSSCNNGLGFFKDNPERLLKAIKYLKVNYDSLPIK